MWKSIFISIGAVILGILGFIFGRKSRSSNNDRTRDIDGIDRIKQSEDSGIRSERDSLEQERDQVKRERKQNGRVGDLLAELEKRRKNKSMDS